MICLYMPYCCFHAACYAASLSRAFRCCCCRASYATDYAYTSRACAYYWREFVACDARSVTPVCHHACYSPLPGLAHCLLLSPTWYAAALFYLFTRRQRAAAASGKQMMPLRGARAAAPLMAMRWLFAPRFSMLCRVD